MNAPNEEAVLIECEGRVLIGVLHRAAGSPEPVGVIIVAGGPQYRVGSHRQFVITARALASSGYPVMRFDYRGMGDSSGERIELRSVEIDIRAAIDALQQKCEFLTGIVLLGLCDGATAVLLAKPEFLPVCGLALVNPWFDSCDRQAQVMVRHYYLRRIISRDFWNKFFRWSVDIRRAVREFASTLHTLAVARNAGTNTTSADMTASMLDGFTGFKGMKLIVLSQNDLTARAFEVLCASSHTWRSALSDPRVSAILLNSADHTFSERRVLDEFNGKLVAWMRDRIGAVR